MYYIERTIEIDAGHRVPTHGSKCRSVHGHRYKIVAGCAPVTGKLHDRGEESGMVMDFGFLKEEMVRVIHDPCDHVFLAWVGDELVHGWAKHCTGKSLAEVREWMGLSALKHGRLPLYSGELIIYPMMLIPTAENLARHWYERLAPAIHTRSAGKAVLKRLTVHETPNSVAVYAPSEV